MEKVDIGGASCIFIGGGDETSSSDSAKLARLAVSKVGVETSLYVVTKGDDSTSFFSFCVCL